MKKLVVLTMVMALLIGIPFCVFAQNDEPRDGSKVCKALAAEYPEDFVDLFKNLGQCVSFVQACSELGNTAECCICRAMMILDLQGYENDFATQGLGSCIASFRAHASNY